MDLITYLNNNPEKQHIIEGYLIKIWNKYYVLSLGGMLALSITEDNPISLPAVYTALTTETDVNSVSGISLEGSYLHKRIYEVKRPFVELSSPRQVTVLEMFQHFSRLVLVGSAGSGKSTFTQFVTLCMAGEILKKSEANLEIFNSDVYQEKLVPWPDGTYLPVCVELRSFVQSNQFPAIGTKGTAQHLINFIDSEYWFEHGASIEFFLKQKELNILLMLDGLDEVPKASEARERIRDAIADFTMSYPTCKMLVTSRPQAYNEPVWQLSNLGFYKTSLASLNKEQREYFVKQWYWQFKEIGRIDETQWTARIKNLVREIERHFYLRELASNPLLLTMIIGVNELNGVISGINRAELYEESVKLLLDRWNRRRGDNFPAITDALGVDIETIRRKLEELAFHIHLDQDSTSAPGYIAYDKLAETLQAVLTNETSTLQDLMDYLNERSGILIADSPTLFRFPHKSLQEFMVACYFIQAGDYHRISDLVGQNPSIWRDVLLFMAWRAKSYRTQEIWHLAEELCPRHFLPTRRVTASEWWGPLYAGLILTETKQHHIERFNTLEGVRSWLQACVERGEMTVNERVEVGYILGRIGDHRQGVTKLDSNNVPEIEWIRIPKGSFLKGSTSEDKDAWANEIPQQKIDLEEFYISKYPITVAHYRAYINSDYCPSSLRSQWNHRYEESLSLLVDNFPVTDVTWNDANAFCDWLSSVLGYEVRLPTEDEWEKAARGTDGRIRPWGTDNYDDHCNIRQTGIGNVCAVGLFPLGKSPYDVMDMIGNVWEWCSSTWHGDYGTQHVGSRFYAVRGGSYGSDQDEARCAYLGREGTELAEGQGFRIVASRLINKK